MRGRSNTIHGVKVKSYDFQGCIKYDLGGQVWYTDLDRNTHLVTICDKDGTEIDIPAEVLCVLKDDVSRALWTNCTEAVE